MQGEEQHPHGEHEKVAGHIEREETTPETLLDRIYYIEDYILNQHTKNMRKHLDANVKQEGGQTTIDQVVIGNWARQSPEVGQDMILSDFYKVASPSKEMRSLVKSHTPTYREQMKVLGKYKDPVTGKINLTDTAKNELSSLHANKLRGKTFETLASEIETLDDKKLDRFAELVYKDMDDVLNYNLYKEEGSHDEKVRRLVNDIQTRHLEKVRNIVSAQPNYRPSKAKEYGFGKTMEQQQNYGQQKKAA
jgi:hypothetical protein